MIVVPRSPLPTTAAVRAVMRGNKSAHTRPETRTRKLLYHLGYRYRVHAKNLPGKPDICFPARRKVIFVHGCFWHQHSSPRCPLKAKPQSNLAYWSSKLDRNRQRDSAQRRALRRQEWAVLVVWECETRDARRLAPRLKRFLGPPGLAGGEKGLWASSRANAQLPQGGRQGLKLSTN
jgi:DNA mismatch endonuclease, patch repair protein